MRGPDFTLLYDAGSNDDLARGNGNRVLAYLATLTPRITRIDHVILSHPHRDHVELLPDVLRKYPVGDVWDSGATTEICGYRNFLQEIAAHPASQYHTATRDAGPETRTLGDKNCYGKDEFLQSIALHHGARIKALQSIPIGNGAAMRFLYVNGNTKQNLNENSLVVRLDLADHRVLLMGDAQGGDRAPPASIPRTDSIEGQLLNCCMSELKADVMVVGNHGSNTSSRTALLDAVQAEVFIVSSGPTPYSGVKLPDSEVLTALDQRARVLRTDDDDAHCASSRAKVGPDNDGKAGGCDNILVTLTAGKAVSASYRHVAD